MKGAIGRGPLPPCPFPALETARFIERPAYFGYPFRGCGSQLVVDVINRSFAMYGPAGFSLVLAAAPRFLLARSFFFHVFRVSPG